MVAPLLSLSLCSSCQAAHPASKFVITSISCSGIPRHRQLSSCDQNPTVSNALLKSVVKACSSCPLDRASSKTSANTLNGTCTPDFGTAPYWLLCSSPFPKTTPATRPIMMCSYHFTKCSINATGRHLPTSDVPLSVFGNSRINATFNTSGICLRCRHCSIIVAHFVRFLSSNRFKRSTVISDRPLALPFFISFKAALTSSRLMAFSHSSHQPCCSASFPFSCHTGM